MFENTWGHNVRQTDMNILNPSNFIRHYIDALLILMWREKLIFLGYVDDFTSWTPVKNVTSFAWCVVFHHGCQKRWIKPCTNNYVYSYFSAVNIHTARILMGNKCWSSFPHIFFFLQIRLKRKRRHTISSYLLNAYFTGQIILEMMSCYEISKVTFCAITSPCALGFWHDGGAMLLCVSCTQ